MGNGLRDDLKARWNDLIGLISEHKDVAERWWQRIEREYTKPDRYYHNLDHLQQMFEHYDQHKDSLRCKDALPYAIFFHDLIYDAKAKDNESQSAAVFTEFSTETALDQVQTSYIVDLIKATETHCTEAHLEADRIGTDDLHYFLDFDMAILGSDGQQYEEYGRKIRQEYAHISDEEFAKRRATVLKTFLQIPNIFATKAFRDLYEDRARQNIQSEIDALQN